MSANHMGESHSNVLQSRREYALLLRRFMAGRLATADYENAYFKINLRCKDEALWHIFAAAWHLYDDIIPHRMTGNHRVEGELRRRIAKWIVFLRSGAVYGGADLPAAHRELSRVRASKAGTIGCGLSIVALLAAVAFGAFGHTGGFFVAMLGVGAGLLTMVSSGGVSLEPEAAARAFGDINDPWPFASVDDLKRAVARPTYLRGR